MNQISLASLLIIFFGITVLALGLKALMPGVATAAMCIRAPAALLIL